MAITAKDVQKLREMTGVGMMDCKKALTASEGDIDKAIEWLREKGLAAQTKKAGKVAAEGVSYAIVADNGVGVVIEVNSQTDFVAKNEVFQAFVKDLALVVANENPADVEALKACTYPGTDRTVSDVTADKVLAIGENIQIRRFVRYAEGVNVPYIHMGGKIGVLVNMEVEGIDAAQVTELGKDVAMQIAAMNPAYLDKSEVDQATLDKEKEIQLAQMANDPKMAAKPEKVKQGIVMGKLGKTSRRTACCSRPSSRRTRPPLRSTWPRLPSSWAARSPSRPSPASLPARALRRRRTTSLLRSLP